MRMLLQVLNAILSDLMSRIWMTYRKGFPAIGEGPPVCSRKACINLCVFLHPQRHALLFC